ncbi:MAG: hypothetical protein ACYC0H_15800 [Solirubrobacteraceae bacterium]
MAARFQAGSNEVMPTHRLWGCPAAAGSVRRRHLRVVQLTGPTNHYSDSVEIVGSFCFGLQGQAGGLLVKDDLTPGIPVESDPLRMALLTDPRLAAVEVLVTCAMAVILSSRRA